MPRAEDFFGPLAAMADHAVGNAYTLRDLLADPVKGVTLLGDIHEKRKELDDISDKLEQFLAAAFIAPIDPEDIAELNVHLHQLGDAIDDDAQLFVALNVEGGRPHALPLCGFLIAAADQMQRATHALKTKAVVQEATEVIRQIERQADAEYQSAIFELFAGTPDPIVVLKWNDVYSRLEDLVDMVHHTGDVLDRVAIKDV